MTAGAIRRSGPGRPRRLPCRLIGDKAYSSGAIRSYLRRRGIRMTIPRRRDERPASRFNRPLYRLRNRVERAINRLKQFRRVAKLYEKLALYYLVMVKLATILLWL